MTERKSFLALYNVFPWFFPDFARLTVDPSEKLRKDELTRFEQLDHDETAAVKALQDK